MWVEIRAKPIIYSGAPRIMAVVRDVTERKKAEEALINLNLKRPDEQHREA